MPKISIIVPAYNIEKYLARCLDSIKDQLYRDFECIMIDDGSKDNSGKICDEYAELDSRFIALHQENGGLSVARNYALQNATGELILFIDGDDYIMPNHLERMVDLLESNDADIVKCDYYRGEIEDVVKQPTITAVSGREFTKSVLTDQVGSQLWQYLFKRELWEGIVSPKGRYAQDMMILHCVTDRAQKIVITDEKLYFYFIDRSDSTSNAPKKKVKGALDRAVAFMMRYEFAEQFGYRDCMPCLLRQVMDFYNNALTLKSPSDDNYQADITQLSGFLKRNRQQAANREYRILGFALAYFPGLYCRIRGKKS